MKSIRYVSIFFISGIFFTLMLRTKANESARLDTYTSDRCRMIHSSIRFLDKVSKDSLRSYFVQQGAGSEKRIREADFNRCCTVSGAKSKCDYVKPQSEEVKWAYSTFCRDLENEIIKLNAKRLDIARKKAVRDKALEDMDRKVNEFGRSCRIWFDESGKNPTYQQRID